MGARPGGVADLAGLIHHHDAGSRYTSITFTERLAEAGIDPSVGSVRDAYDNALAESVIGLYKTELITPGGPWRMVEQIEIATLEYVDWFNHRPLYEACGDIPPAELEAAHYRHQWPSSPRPATQAHRSPDTPGGFRLANAATTFIFELCERNPRRIKRWPYLVLPTRRTACAYEPEPSVPG